MRSRYKLPALLLVYVGLLLAIFLIPSETGPGVTGNKPDGSSASTAAPKQSLTEGRRQKQAEAEERKAHFYGDEVVSLYRKGSRFIAAESIRKVLDHQASNHERVREGIISEFKTTWTLIYDSPLNVEFWDLAFEAGVPREKVQQLRRPSDNPGDWPAWIDRYKAAVTAGDSLDRFGRESGRIYHVASPEIRSELLDANSQTRKGWEDPVLQRLAALTDKMIADNDWPEWPTEPDWDTLVDKFIISGIPDLIDKAVQEFPLKQQEMLRRYETRPSPPQRQEFR